MRVSFLRWQPPADLALVVRDVWTLQGRPEPTHDAEPILPDGCPELVINRADAFERVTRVGPNGADSWERQPIRLLVGPQTTATWIRPTGEVDLIGIRLQPWGIGLLIGPVAGELREELPAAEQVAPDLAGALLTAVDGCRGKAVVDGIARVLRERLDANRHHRLRTFERLALAARRIVDRGASVASAATAAGLGRRRLERLFQREVGFAPATLRRIHRFQQAVGVKTRDPGLSWARIAALVGYADQSHLTRDFRVFAGRPPGGHPPATEGLTSCFLDGPAA
jgi:AraC-like DNA-binding protein